MACCYLIQSHTNEAQLLRLVSVLKASSPTAQVLVVHDARCTRLDPAPFLALAGVDVLQREKPVDRARLSLLEPMFDGLEVLLGRREGRVAWDFDWLVYLSGQDYPVRPLPEIEGFLEASGYDGFLSYWDIHDGPPANPWRKRQGPRRYLAQYRRLPHWARGPLKAARILEKVSPVRTHLHYGEYLGWKPRRNPFGAGFRCYGGRQWWTLSRRCVEYLRSSLSARKDVVEWFRRTMVPDEALVQTLLVNSGRFNLFPHNRRYVDFSRSPDGHPRLLDRSDLPELTGGPYDFARKLDPAYDPEILSLLDERVLGTSGGERALPPPGSPPPAGGPDLGKLFVFLMLAVAAAGCDALANRAPPGAPEASPRPAARFQIQ